MYRCVPCQRLFRTQKLLWSHMRYSPAHTLARQCEPCKRTFVDEAALTRHMLYHSAHAKGSLEAFIAQTSNGTGTKLTAVQEAQLRGIGLVACTPCNRLFTSDETLQTHARKSCDHKRRVRNQERDRPFESREVSQRASPHQTRLAECGACDSVFTNEIELTDHVDEEHAGFQGPISSMHSRRHDEVLDLLGSLEWSFHRPEDADGFRDDYDTRIMGHFLCSNTQCRSKKWSSWKIAVTIQRFEGNRYNAMVWHQKCQGCDQHGRLVLDESYAERVAYRLKVWSGVRVERPPFGGESKGPHDSTRCEGCRNGHCGDAP